MSRRVSRRALLRGAGVCITLPWLESLSTPASAEVTGPPKRFVAIFLPNGAPELWKPPTAGVGAAWQLSGVLAPLQALKTKLTVISGLENATVFNADGTISVEPSDGRQAGAWLTCQNADAVRQKLGVQEANGVSLDQVLASNTAFAGKSALASLQVGLSSEESSCDGRPCSLSRSISWKTETTPLGKLVDPSAVFDRLMGVWPSSDPALAARRETRKSVLDAVQDTASATRERLSASDKLRLDEFLSTVRSVETTLIDVPANACPTTPTQPNFPAVGTNYRQDGGGYTKSAHADLMNELCALALQCDRTRIISYMLEDQRAEYSYDFVPRRVFTATSSTLDTGNCGNWHGAQHGSQDEFASIVNWNVGKVATFCQRLDAMGEGDSTVLDNTVVLLGSGMHGSNHAPMDLPTLLVGGGGGSLKTNTHLAFAKRPLRDLYFTLLNGVYGAGVTDFGSSAAGGQIAPIAELLT